MKGDFVMFKKQDKKIYWHFNNGVFFSYTYWLCYKCKYNRSCTHRHHLDIEWNPPPPPHHKTTSWKRTPPPPQHRWKDDHRRPDAPPPPPRHHRIDDKNKTSDCICQRFLFVIDMKL